jgi:hypothetical protein
MVIGFDNMSTFCEDKRLANGHDLGQRPKLPFIPLLGIKIISNS